jgi:hypothetical protein
MLRQAYLTTTIQTWNSKNTRVSPISFVVQFPETDGLSVIQTHIIDAATCWNCLCDQVVNSFENYCNYHHYIYRFRYSNANSHERLPCKNSSSFYCKQKKKHQLLRTQRRRPMEAVKSDKVLVSQLETNDITEKLKETSFCLHVMSLNTTVKAPLGVSIMRVTCPVVFGWWELCTLLTRDLWGASINFMVFSFSEFLSSVYVYLHKRFVALLKRGTLPASCSSCSAKNNFPYYHFQFGNSYFGSELGFPTSAVEIVIPLYNFSKFSTFILESIIYTNS